MKSPKEEECRAEDWSLCDASRGDRGARAPAGRTPGQPAWRAGKARARAHRRLCAPAQPLPGTRQR